MSAQSTFFTIQSFNTLAGTATATFIVSSAIQSAFNYNPKWLALLIAEVFSFLLLFNCGQFSFGEIILAIINGCLIYLTAIGGNTVISKKNVKGKAKNKNFGGVGNSENETRRFSSSWF